MNKITKAVFPVAGLGTRFLPATKVNPKEMLPIVDKPLIQYAVEEAIEAGIKDLIFVTRCNKRAIEDHFDTQFELEQNLLNSGKHDLVPVVHDVIPKDINCIYVRQSAARGLGHAVLCAKSVVNHEPFAVLLADDLINAKPGALAQMVAEYNKYSASIIAVEKVAFDNLSKYGVIGFGDQNKAQNIKKLTTIIEKPNINQAPSDLGVVGRYILTPKIFEILENLAPGSGNEIQLTDAIAKLLELEACYGFEFQGKRYDCGSKLGYLEASVEYGLMHEEVGEDFKNYLNKLCN